MILGVFLNPDWKIGPIGLTRNRTPSGPGHTRNRNVFWPGVNRKNRIKPVDAVAGDSWKNTLCRHYSAFK